MPLSQDASASAGEPSKKKAKIGTAVKPNEQSSLFKFFSSSAKKKNAEESRAKNAIQSDNEPKLESKPQNGGNDDKQIPKTISKANPSMDANDVAAMVPKAMPPSSASWQSLYDKCVLIRKPRLKPKTGGENPPPRQKVAAFDMDGTLFRWVSDSPGFWPSQLSHYELWNSNVVTRMQRLYDEENRLLVIFTNQGGIQGAHTGKKAGLLKAIIDWLESIVRRPLVVVASTKSLKNKKYADQSFHKPTPKMWKKVLVPYFGRKSAPLDAPSSFFVGDSADDDDAQGGVDKKFAENAGIGAFYTPEEYFGPSHKELRQRQAELGGGDGGDQVAVPTIPKSAIEARKALLGGYHTLDETSPSPIVILLVGVQGSGKSTFSRKVLFGNSVDNNNSNNGSDMNYSANRKNRWVWLSQDTINNGKPGKREKVESQAREELDKGNSIILDRMHLDPEQRETIIDNTVNEHPNTPIHIVVFRPPKDLIEKRVRSRTNHPGKVEGEKGARMALSSIGQLVLPKYTELEGRVKLISYVSTEHAAKQLALRYHEYHTIDVVDTNNLGFQSAKNVPIVASSSKSSAISIPAISLGTMKIGRRICAETVQNLVQLGVGSIDTAPTYKNEDKIGDALQQVSRQDNDIFLIAKIPKRATTKEQVQTEFEKTLQQLNRKDVDLLLLHWPSDVIAQGTLREVWTCMEEFVKQQKCKALGVCNFNEGALMQLLRHCTVPPVLNQVERHPLLPQFELLEFCSRHNILVQAHTPFGGDQGKEEILNHSVIGTVARETTLSPAQVIVQWNLQHGVVVVAKCSQEKHAKEILSCTNDSNNTPLSPKHMKALDALGNERENLRRFVAPPFMYGSKAIFCWGEQIPQK